MQSWFARAISGAIILGFGAMLSGAPALAAPADKSALVPAVLVVDLPQVLHASKAGQGVQTTVGQAMQTYSKDVAREEDDLQRMRADLERQHTVLSQTAFDTKAKALQLHYQELNRDVQAKRQAMQNTYNEAMVKVEKAALEIVGQLAKERGANLVVLKQAVVYSPDSTDITAEVLARLDKNLTSVPIVIPKTESSAARPARRPAQKSPPAPQQKFDMNQ
jgi:outer membrane protein